MAELTSIPARDRANGVVAGVADHVMTMIEQLHRRCVARALR